ERRYAPGRQRCAARLVIRSWNLPLDSEFLEGLVSGAVVSDEDVLQAPPVASASGGGLPGTSSSRPRRGVGYRLGQLLGQPSVLAVLAGLQLPLDVPARGGLLRGMR